MSRPLNCGKCKKPKSQCKCGRPTKMTPETLKKLEEAFANGATDAQACFYANISHQTLYNYQDSHPEFIERKEGLKQQLNLIAKNVIARKIKSGDEKTAQWHLERKEKGEYSLKVEQDHSSSDGTMRPQHIIIQHVKPKE